MGTKAHFLRTPGERMEFKGSNTLCARHPISRLVIGLLCACGGQDPILDRADEIREQGGPSANETPGISTARDPGRNNSQSGQSNQPSPGKPGEPPPGNPDPPSPGVPDPSQEGHQDAKPPIQGSGPAARISGVVQIPEGMTGTVHIMAFASDPAAARKGGRHPDVAGFTQLNGTGDFSFELANGGAPVWLDAHLDQGPDFDGRPGPGEPTGFLESGIPTTEDTSGIVLELEVRPHQDPPDGGAASPPPSQ